MLINIGGNIRLFKKDIVGIFDFDEFTSSVEGQEFFRYLKKGKLIENADDKKVPQSIILCVDEKNNEKYYLSPTSVASLRKNQSGDM